MDEGGDKGFKIVEFRTQGIKMDLKGIRFLERGMKEAFGITSLDANFGFSLEHSASMRNLGIHMVFDLPFLCGSLQCIVSVSNLGIRVVLDFSFCLVGLCGLSNCSFFFWIRFCFVVTCSRWDMLIVECVWIFGLIDFMLGIQIASKNGMHG